MSNIDKIRQEIERLKQYAESSKMEWIDDGYNQNAFAETCRISSFDKLLSFIDSLPEESTCPKESDDLKEAAENYIAPIENDKGLNYINFNGRDIKDAFIARAEWMAKQGVSMEVVRGVPWRAVDAFIHDNDYTEDSIIQIRKK